MSAPPVRDTHKGERSPGGQTVQALERGLLLLGAFRDHSNLSLAQLGAHLPVHRTSTLRLVHTLERQGYLARDGAGRYRLGPALHELGALALARLDVRALARPALERLAAETGETVQLVVRDGGDILVVDGIESAHRVKVGAGRGERRPLHATASGKCFLATLPEPEVERLLRDLPLTALTPQTLVRPGALLDDLRAVRARGYAVNLEESEAGARFVAAPIRGPARETVAALAVGAPADRLPRPRLGRLGERLRAVAAALSGDLGAPPSRSREEIGGP
jgi:IclR family acetate operon transcriptional repressor